MSRWWPWGKVKLSRNIYKPPPVFTKSEADWLWNGDANPWLWKRKEPEVMGVKVEKIEPKPQAKFRATGANGESLSHFDWTESEARAIYEGLAEHFGGLAARTSYGLEDLLVTKNAEIARLKALSSVNKDREIELLDREVVRLKAAYDRVIEDNDRLRGWLEWIKESSKHFDPPNGRCESAMDAAWRALAGKKVPE